MSFELIIESRWRSMEADIENITNGWKDTLFRLIDAQRFGSTAEKNIYNNVVSKPMALFLIDQMEESQGNVNDFKLGVEKTFNVEDATNGDFTIENIYWDQFAKSINRMFQDMGGTDEFDEIKAAVDNLKNTMEDGCIQILELVNKKIDEIGNAIKINSVSGEIREIRNKIKATNSKEKIEELNKKLEPLYKNLESQGASKYHFLVSVYYKCKYALSGFADIKKGYRPIGEPKEFRGYRSDAVYKRLRLSGHDAVKFRELIKTDEWEDYKNRVRVDLGGGKVATAGSSAPDRFQPGKEILTDDGKIVYNPYYIEQKTYSKHMADLVKPIFDIANKVKIHIKNYLDYVDPEQVKQEQEYIRNNQLSPTLSSSLPKVHPDSAFRYALTSFLRDMNRVFIVYWLNPKRFCDEFDDCYNTYMSKTQSEDEDISSGYVHSGTIPDMMEKLRASKNYDGEMCYRFLTEYIERCRELAAAMKSAYMTSKNLINTYFHDEKEEYSFTKSEWNDIEQTIDGNLFVKYYLNLMMKNKMDNAAEIIAARTEFKNDQVNADIFQEANRVLMRLDSDMKKYDTVSGIIFSDSVAKEINKIVSKFNVQFEFSAAFPGGVSNDRLELENTDGEIRAIDDSIEELRADFDSGTSPMSKTEFDKKLNELNLEREAKRIKKNALIIDSKINDVRKRGAVAAINLDNYKTILSEMDADAISHLKLIIKNSELSYAGLT